MPMKSSILLVGLIVAAAPAAARTHIAHRPVRTVQLISMTPPPPTSDAPADVGSGDAAPEPMAAPPPGFQTHDLSRRWVEFQMAQRLQGSAPAVAAAGDPFRVQERASLTGTVPGVSLAVVGIPGWMQAVTMPAVSSTSFAPGCDARPYRPSGFLAVGAEARRLNFYGMMSRIACDYGLPVGLFDAMIIRESRYDPVVVSPKKAFGLTQLMPGTAAELGVDRYDVMQNLRGGARYLRSQLDRFGQYHLALAAYNAGPGRVRGAVPAIPETRAYVDDILRNWGRLSGFEQSVAARRLTSDVTASRANLARSATLLAFR
ncbi:lytic transglycosylase domain-containing protein [Sphingomonas sp. MA1305]|jgi:soluble lytic murein transglycosylase-like protein|uniref:lytic transglycosylase domain-containing protein n=1 Tax=Sphingomonas sp. MA1305 TaxID=2479204 RepID=UPI001E4D4949|nr:lytic transglycosylase domain-containing protein [Sphingomonas sp. MA1305]